MADWCKICDGRGKMDGFFIPIAVAGKERWIEVPTRPCVFCLGQGVMHATDKPLFIPPDNQTS
jgi:hypothetical protein